ncbi:MAG: hypothetical protein GX432_12765 [Candidatus Atribacteria bacterium]|nr:hypothetical protein [Candidatus Atribacteria bacterium]
MKSCNYSNSIIPLIAKISFVFLLLIINDGKQLRPMYVVVTHDKSFLD